MKKNGDMANAGNESFKRGHQVYATFTFHRGKIIQ